MPTMYHNTPPTVPRTTISPGSDSGRESAAPVEMVYSSSDGEPGGISYQYDNARKRAMRMAANQTSGDSKINEEPPQPQNGQTDVFGRARGPAVNWGNAPPQTQAPVGQSAPPQAQAVHQPHPPTPEQPQYTDSSRRGTGQSSVVVESDPAIDWVAQRKKDSEERMLERTEREQERAQRRREMEERAQDRQERKKEREERAVEREERRREREELLRIKSSANGISTDHTSAHKIQELERANAQLTKELDVIKAELQAVKNAMQAEQDKTSSLVQYMKLFQFPDEREININKLRNLIACAQQQVANIVNLKSANWWMALGPSQETRARSNKALELLGNRRIDGVATSLFQCEPAMAYIVEYNSRLGIQRNQDYTVFGWFSREVYFQAWNSLNKVGDEAGRIEPAAFHALLDFVCANERS